MPASWYLLTAHSSCIKQPIKHHAPRSLGLQRCSQYPACPHSQPRSSVPSLLQPASSPASSGGSRWSGALRPAGSTFACRFNFGCSSSRCRSSSRCWRSSRCWSSSRSLRRAAGPAAAARLVATNKSIVASSPLLFSTFFFHEPEKQEAYIVKHSRDTTLCLTLVQTPQ